MKLFEELNSIAILDRKNSAWSQQQNFSERAKMLQEEVEEMIGAIKNEDYQNLQEELGDIIWDALTIAAIAEEKTLFTTQQVLSRVSAKIKRRKPWIFTNEKLGAEEESRRWKEAKKREKK